MRLGVSMPLDGFSLSESVDLAGHAESLGYTDVWTSEIGGSDGFSPLAAVAVRTRQLRLGVGIASVFTRPPALIAMTAASIQLLSGGRFCLGLGASTEAIVNQWMGLELRRPVARLRETVEAVQLALSGGRVSYDGETVALRDFRLQLPAMDPIPVLVGALGPRMLRLAGEIGDGVILSQVALSAVPGRLADVWAGVEASGRLPGGVDVVQRVGVAVDEDEELLRPVLRRELAAYGRSSFYRASFERQGFGQEARALGDAWERGDGSAAATAVSDRLIEDVFVFGDATTCRERLGGYRAAGICTPVVIPISVHPDRDERKRRRVRTLEVLASAA